MAGAVAWAVIERPGFGLCVLVALVWLNLSEVLVRYHGAPSVLQLLAVPLAVAAWASPREPMESHPLTRPLTALLAGWLLFLLLSTTWAPDTGFADERVLETGKAFLVFALVGALAVTRRRLVAAAWVAVASGTALAGLGLFQIASGSFDREFGGLARVKDAQIWGDVFEGRIAGPLGDPNYFAHILLVLVPVALVLGRHARTRSRRWTARGMAAVLVAGTLATYSRGGMLALAVVIGLTLLLLRVDPRRILAGAVAAALVGILFLPADVLRRLETLGQILPGQGTEEVLDPDSSFEKRKLVTAVAWREFVENPILGVGAGNYSVHFDRHAARIGSAAREYDEPDARQYPHNLYLEIAAETGVVGLTLFLGALGAAFVALRRARRRFERAGDRAAADLAGAFAIALTGYLVSSLFLHGDFQRYLWVLLAFAAALEAIAPEKT
ncbi:MAG: O-antigen ligase family protein [Gemmatimonadota bacterium]|nr:O-antigen ligase family protein [Gemmatimonadota bacterium]